MNNQIKKIIKNIEHTLTKRELIVLSLIILLHICGIIVCNMNFIKGNLNPTNRIFTLLISFLFFLILFICNILVKDKRSGKFLDLGIKFIIPFICYILVEYIIVGSFTINIKYNIYNIILYLSVFALIWGIIGNYNKAGFVSITFFVIFALIQYYIISFRGRPILASDIFAIKTAVAVADAYDFSIDFRILLSIIIIYSIIVICFLTKIDKIALKARIIRGAIFITIGCSIISLVIFSPIMKKMGVWVNYWEYESSCKNNGYFFSALYSANNLIVSKPSNYKEDISSYNILEYKVDKSKQSPTNIIVIMNESWADLSLLGDLETNKPYNDYYNNLTKNVVKGYLNVNTFGGGTSLTEYELLTGNTTTFLPEGVPPYQTYYAEKMCGLATTMKAQGYTTIAMHPGGRSSWNRQNIYPMMQFNSYSSVEDWPYDTVRGLVSDQSNIDRLINYFSSKPTGEKTFIFNITIQNHGGYVGEYDDFKTDIYTTNLSKEYDDVNNYLTLVSMTDDSIKYILDYFSEYDDNTMIVMFGDHYPALNKSFYNEILGDNPSEEKLENQYKTPYFIWTNYDSNLTEIGNTSSNYLGSYILLEANLEMTEYNRFLIELSKNIPEIGHYGIYNNNSFISYNSEEYKNCNDLLNKYWNIEYKYIFDKNDNKYFTIE